jgi:formylglycine-generating enzyme required for sulfatase activity
VRRAAFGLFLIVATAAVVQAAEPPRPARAVRHNSLAMQFVRIPAGELRMGSPADDPAADADERPQHRVRVTLAFYLGRYEVTQSEYRAVRGENPSWFSTEGGGRDEVRGVDTSNHPVEYVTWDEAAEFCRRLSELPTERAAGRWYRLPTEAEWEYAARAGTTTSFHTGDALPAGAANVRSGAVGEVRTTRPVGSYAPNAWGFYDMHGNAWEWCADRYDSDGYAARAHPTAERIAVDPQGPLAGTGRVVRGGDYRFDAREARSANRDFTRQSRRDWGNGFRVVLVAGDGEK